MLANFKFMGLISNGYIYIFTCVLKVHITQGDHEGKAVIVSWVTVDERGSSKVLYWSEDSEQTKHTAEGIVVTYKYYNYTSGYIHHCNLTDLRVINFFFSNYI